MPENGKLDGHGNSPDECGEEYGQPTAEVILEQRRVHLHQKITESHTYLFVDAEGVDYHCKALNAPCNQSCYCRTPCSHLGESEISEDEAVVQAYVDYQRTD